MCLFQLTHLEQQKGKWRKKLYKQASTNSSKTSKQDQRSSLKLEIYPIFLCREENFHKKPMRSTHAHKYKRVPFLLARSSFRGLSKNMASEEDAFKRQEKQGSLRAADFPLLEMCCWLCPGRNSLRGHTETSTIPRSPSNTMPLLEKKSGCILRVDSFMSPLILVSVLYILKINSACRNNCMQW